MVLRDIIEVKYWIEYFTSFVYLVCSDGFTGMNCEMNIDDRATDPCVNGTCNDLVNGYS